MAGDTVTPWILPPEEVEAMRDEANRKGPNALYRLAVSHQRLQEQYDRMVRAHRDAPSPPREVPRHTPGAV